MVTIYSEHTRSKNIEATLRGNKKMQFSPVVLVTTYNELTRSRNTQATFRGDILSIVHSSSNGYDMY